MPRPGGVRGMSKATELLSQARCSVGVVIGLDEDKWELQKLLETFERIEMTIQEADNRITNLLPEIPCAELLQSVGLTAPASAVILAFGGDLRNFMHGNQLLRKAGLNLAEQNSGKHKGKIKLSKRGNALLRKHLFFSMLHLVSKNPIFKQLHEYNVQVKRMSKMKSIMKLVGKLAHILVAMAREGQPFSNDKVQIRAA